MELGLLELFTTNEKLQAIEECRKVLESEINSSRERYETLREEHYDLQQQLVQVAEEENKNRHIEVINELNNDKNCIVDRKNLYKKDVLLQSTWSKKK